MTTIVDVWQECIVFRTLWLVFQQTATVWCTTIRFDIENESFGAVVETGSAGRTNEIALTQVQTREQFDVVVLRTLDGWQMASVWRAVNILWTIAC